MHIKTPAAPADTTTITVSVCPRCGTIARSGKLSCCGRGGSWFDNCGGVGNTKLQHTWYEGIQACKTRTQSKTVIGQQLNVVQPKDTPQGAGVGNSKAAVIAAATTTFAFTSVNTSRRMPDTTSIVTATYYAPDNMSITTSAHTLMTNTATKIWMTSSTHTSASTSIITQGCVNLLKVIVHVNLLFIMIFY